MRQAAQRSGSTLATTPPTSIESCEIKQQALEEAARAWETLSSINRGEWAIPQIKIPSDCVSTGRSLTWASKKKRSLVTGTLYLFYYRLFILSVSQEVNTHFSCLSIKIF
jgi:hypothetical protein